MLRSLATDKTTARYDSNQLELISQFGSNFLVDSSEFT